jgi:hypothetical protein
MADINLGVGGANSAVAGGYEIENSLKLESDNTEYLSRTPSSAGNRRTWTLSCWVKRTEITADSNSVGNQHMILSAGNTYIQFDGNAIWVNLRAASENFFLATNRLFRDTSAWYHVVLQCDTTQGTASNRAKLWVNGVQETSFQNSTYDNMPLNYETLMNNTNEHEVGKYSNEETTYANFFSGYMAEMHLVDGTALAPTDFGEFDEDSGIWKPKAYTGSYGTNGFYLDFESSGSLGADSSGNGNNFTPTNITSADQATDTPTNNFCTLNPIFAVNSGVGELTISEGGTRTVNAANAYKFATSTIGVTRGKWYWEVNGTYVRTISLAGVIMPYYWLNGNIAFSGTVYYAQSGQRYNNSSASSFGPGWGDGDIIAFALDMDASTPTLNVYKNNTSLGDLFSGLSLTGSGATFLPPKEDGYFAKLVNYGTNTFDINFGGYTAASISSPATDENGYGTFEYAPPTGYYALCTKNLAEYG